MGEVTQADREAAARLVSKMGDTIRALNITCGNLDDAPEVQAFARHRIAERERCARIGYRTCAETRHVSLGDAVDQAIRSSHDQI